MYKFSGSSKLSYFSKKKKGNNTHNGETYTNLRNIFSKLFDSRLGTMKGHKAEVRNTHMALSVMNIAT